MQLSIAPMIDWTYVHFRVWMRILAPNAFLYTEMQTVGAIMHAPDRALDYHESELPWIALQLGGSDPTQLAQAARLAQARGFNEINLNLGCPSDRVQSGQFGACLMNHPLRVKDCLRAIKDAVDLPVSAKLRIGIDDQDEYSFFSDFVGHLIEASCDKYIVHARKAWLTGLSPKQNRTIPPLHYDYVYRLKQEHPTQCILLNGQLQPEHVLEYLSKVDGVMFGRLAYEHPYAIAKIHQMLYPDVPLRSRSEALEAYILYLSQQTVGRQSTSFVLKPILNLVHGLPQAKAWKKQALAIDRWQDPVSYQPLLDTLRRIETFG